MNVEMIITLFLNSIRVVILKEQLRIVQRKINRTRNDLQAVLSEDLQLTVSNYKTLKDWGKVDDSCYEQHDQKIDLLERRFDGYTEEKSKLTAAYFEYKKLSLIY